MPTSFMENYKEKHQHPLNRLCHSIGIPMIVVSLPLFFFSWKWALALFVVGWIFQFAGHAIEGNQPAFFKNPMYLLAGPMWIIHRIGAALGLSKAPAQRSSEDEDSRAMKLTANARPK
jgi:uncharacterized membrane protein YGL010W